MNPLASPLRAGAALQAQRNSTLDAAPGAVVREFLRSPWLLPTRKRPMTRTTLASTILLVIPLLVAAPPAAAQNRFEVGGLALVTAYRSADVASGPRVGSVGFQPGPSAGGFLGQTMGNRLGGEIRYLYSQNDLKLSSGATEVKFAGRSHLVGYDLLVYATGRDSRIRPYAAAGGGLKIYEGTGAEQPFQPLSNLALLTQTREALPAVDFGGGVKFQATRNMAIRFEFRDYLTNVPRVFDAAPGAKVSGLLHHWVPAVGFSFSW